eukprot:TRINITY_DN29039_c0_g1_i4.p1 TRINITY_DN29039_c0_g1~~TRINITY_DN29039_c0_g1_i4.p1  ORF type:complete len:203 (-),score=36.97 TRINITY_DN29039_c0_g1_i4:180-788(-)
MLKRNFERPVEPPAGSADQKQQDAYERALKSYKRYISSLHVCSECRKQMAHRHGEQDGGGRGIQVEKTCGEKTLKVDPLKIWPDSKVCGKCWTSSHMLPAYRVKGEQCTTSPKELERWAEANLESGRRVFCQGEQARVENEAAYTSLCTPNQEEAPKLPPRRNSLPAGMSSGGPGGLGGLAEGHNESSSPGLRRSQSSLLLH